MSDWRCGYCRETIAADEVSISIEEGEVEALCPDCSAEGGSLFESGHEAYKRALEGDGLEDVVSASVIQYALAEAVREVDIMWGRLETAYCDRDAEECDLLRGGIRMAESAAETIMDRGLELRPEREAVT
jgi:hypothetical protein